MVCHSLASIKNLPSKNIFSLAGFHQNLPSKNLFSLAGFHQTHSIQKALLNCWLHSILSHHRIKQEQLFSAQSLCVCVLMCTQVRPSTQARHAEQKGTPDSDRNVCMCKTTMPRGAGGANRQDDVDEEGRGATRRNVGGHAVPRRSPLEIGLSAGCADPLIRQDLPAEQSSPFGRVRL